MKASQIKIGAILLYITIFVSFALSMLFTPIILRTLGKNEYGLYNLVVSTVSYFNILNFGFNSAYIKYYSRYKVRGDEERVDKLNGLFFIVFSLIGLIALIIGLLIVFNASTVFGNKLTKDEIDKAAVLMAILVFNMSLTFLTTVFNLHVTANERYIFQKTIMLVKTTINPLLMTGVLFLGFRSIGMVIAATLLNIIYEMSMIVYCFKKLDMKFCFKNFDLGLMKEIIIFSSYIFFNLIVDQINLNANQFLIGRIKGAASVAVYGIAAQLYSHYMSISATMTNLFSPRINQMVEKGESNKEITFFFTRVSRVQFILLTLVLSGFLILGRPFINMWAGKGYEDAYIIVLLLIFPITFSLIQNIGIEIQKAKNMHKFRSRMYFTVAIFNVIINIFLIKKFDIIGAAAGNALAVIVGNIFLMNWYYHNKLKLDMKYFWKEIIYLFPALITSTVIGYVITLLLPVNGFKYLIIDGILYVCVFVFIMYLMGMNTYEKNLLKKSIFLITHKNKR